MEYSPVEQGDKELFHFLASAPKEFREGEKIRKYQLKNGDYIHCVLWNMHFYITGTDIVKILVWRFQNAGRQIGSLKKFEEGVFSDLRNLKPGIDAKLEGPRSEFLEFLYKNGCIRTQKKQKVFFWYSVPHDALFCDALERDLRRETNLYTYSKYMCGGQSIYSRVPFMGQKKSKVYREEKEREVKQDLPAMEVTLPRLFEGESSYSSRIQQFMQPAKSAVSEYNFNELDFLDEPSDFPGECFLQFEPSFEKQRSDCRDACIDEISFVNPKKIASMTNNGGGFQR
jgi:STE like transcription factor